VRSFGRVRICIYDESLIALLKEPAAECLTDTRLEMTGRPLAYKVSAPFPLSKVDRNSAQLIYPDTVFVFEVL
jgi:hypothetical protein